MVPAGASFSVVQLRHQAAAELPKKWQPPRNNSHRAYACEGKDTEEWSGADKLQTDRETCINLSNLCIVFLTGLTQPQTFWEFHLRRTRWALLIFWN